MVAAKPPKGVAFSFDTCHVHEEPSSLTIDLSAYRALIVEDGDNSFIEKVHIEPIITLMGIPEIVVARDMASMEKTQAISAISIPCMDFLHPSFVMCW